jgi:hypothetical protein
LAISLFLKVQEFYKDLLAFDPNLPELNKSSSLIPLHWNELSYMAPFRLAWSSRLPITPANRPASVFSPRRKRIGQFPFQLNASSGSPIL